MQDGGIEKIVYSQQLIWENFKSYREKISGSYVVISFDFGKGKDVFTVCGKKGGYNIKSLRILWVLLQLKKCWLNT